MGEYVPSRGVLLQRDDGSYCTYPHQLNEEVVKAFLKLDVPIAFTMSSEVTGALLAQLSPEQTSYNDPRSGINLPIVDSVEAIASGKVHVPRESFICMCREEQFVLVWGETVESILQQGSDIETWLIGLVSLHIISSTARC